jgi:site-specific DNA recombinase
LGDEIRKANLAKLKQGEWPHKPPVGYKSVKGTSSRVEHVPDEAKGPLIRQAFELFASGDYSLKVLSEEMFARGLATGSGRMYSEENMKRILSRDFYVGRIVWNGTAYEGKHRPIVPKALFHRVQEVLKKRSADTGEKGRLDFLLRGLAYCAVCHRRLTGEIHPRGSYYHCLRAVDGPRCPQPYSPVKALDGQLERLYEALRQPPELIELLKVELEEIVHGRKKQAEREVGRLRTEIGETEQKEIRLLDEMLAGRVNSEIYEKMAKRFVEKRRQLGTRLAQLDVDYDDPLATLDESAKVASALSDLHRRFTFDERKDLLRAVFTRIEVADRAIVGVTLNPPFSTFFKDSLSKLF